VGVAEEMCLVFEDSVEKSLVRSRKASTKEALNTD